MSADPFATGALRDAVLDAWLRSPTRLREDTNAEAELADEGYRDAVIWELLQNACDAATQAPNPRAWVRLVECDTPYLEVANTGAPLTSQGVASLASLRASSKIPDASGPDSAPLGRFGVGFAAVRAVSDHIEIHTRVTGDQWQGVRFSHRDLHAALAEQAAHHPHVAAVLHDHAAALPALRWPQPVTGSPGGVPPEAITVVRVHLRSAEAVARVRRNLDALDERVLFALPLDTLDLAGRTCTREHLDATWWWHRETFDLSPADLDSVGGPGVARGGSVLWAVPKERDLDPLTNVVWAPTPTLDRLPLNALLVAGFPVNSMREHVLDVAAAYSVARAAGAALAGFAERLTREGENTRALRLVPRGGAPNAIVGALFESAAIELRRAAIVPVVTGGYLGPEDACALEEGLAAQPRFAALAASAGFAHLATLRWGDAAAQRLGIERVSAADIIEQLPTGAVDWQERYSALATCEAELRGSDALGALAVPLADGRVVRGCRGVVRLVGEAEGDAFFDAGAGGGLLLAPDQVEFLQQFGLRVVDPEAFHPLLERLGLAPLAVPEALAGDLGRAVCAEVQRHFDEGDEDAAEALSAALLGLLHTVEANLGSRGWRVGQALPLERLHLLNLVVEDEQRELAPLRNVCLPGAVALDAYHVDWLTAAADETVAEFGVAALAWCGAAVQVPQVDLSSLLESRPDEVLHDLPEDLEDEVSDCREWLEQVVASAGRAYPVALRDAHQVRDEAWPDVLRHLDSAAPAGVKASRYESWWLSEVVLDGATLVSPLTGEDNWYAQIEGLDLGIHLVPEWAAPLTLTAELRGDFDHDLDTALARVDPVAARDALGTAPEHLAPGGLDARLVQSLWRRAVQRSAGSESADRGLPAAVWIVDTAGIPAYVDADDITVVSSAMWVQRSDLGPLWVAGDEWERVAADLDLRPLPDDVGETLTWTPASTRRELHLETRLRAARLALAGLGRTTAPWPQVKHCASLLCEGVPVEWWVSETRDAAGGSQATVYASTDFGLCQGVALALGLWCDRYAIYAVVTGVESAAGAARG
ncbi:hypothetical protein JT358_11070 [Micrococcales bacterium 31B]|nr:hypothetical protein [Micrococcales bacterium 31B]